MYNNSKNQKINLKVPVIGILIVTILVSYNSYGIALADPAHCDRSGFPSCYDVGFGDGQASPGTSCPSGHSARFCEGWDAGANSGSSTSTDTNNGDSTSQNPPSNQNSNINWMSICNTLQIALIPSCSSLVNSDNTLTPQGETALGCIRNGALLGGGALLLKVPTSIVTRGLSALAAPTGCGGIVNMDELNGISGLGNILNLLP